MSELKKLQEMMKSDPFEGLDSSNAKLEKLKRLLMLVDESISRKEFLDAFKALTEFVKKTDSNLSYKVDNKLVEVDAELKSFQRQALQRLAEIETNGQTTLANVKKWALESVVKLVAKSGLDKKAQEIDDKLAELNDKEWPNSQVIALEASKMAQVELEKMIPKLDWSQELPKYGAEIRNALELLPDGEKLEIDAIQDLREELEKLRKLIANKTVTYGGGSTGGRTVKIYDLSSQLNGVTTTFSLPAFWRIINVHSTSFPNSAFRPDVDYTASSANNTITFTSEINASTTLSAGQTLLIEYAE